MKVILNEDVKHLGEEGDVKDVAAGYARNYLLPRNLAVPCNDFTLAYFESRREEIEARKAEKRKAAASEKDRLEAEKLVIAMPAGPNGKLYGAVTSQTIAEALQKQGFDIERKKIEVPGATIKSAGNFTIHIRLYENAIAEVALTVEAKLTKEEAAKKARNEKRAEEENKKTEKAEESVEEKNTESEE